MYSNLMVIIVFVILLYLKASPLYGLLVGESVVQCRLYECRMQTVDLDLLNMHPRCPACPKVTIHK